MNVVIDMNLSADWIPVLSAAGHTVSHWKDIGKPNAKDREILEWAKQNQHAIFTHDLDFSALLAASNANFPSVVQLRDEDVLPGQDDVVVLQALDAYKAELKSGALVTIDKRGKRVRMLPLRKV